jgi:hypothetical protein
MMRLSDEEEKEIVREAEKLFEESENHIEEMQELKRQRLKLNFPIEKINDVLIKEAENQEKILHILYRSSNGWNWREVLAQEWCDRCKNLYNPNYVTDKCPHLEAKVKKSTT